MLAKRRKHNVAGRTKTLTSSIILKKGARYQGELGKNTEKGNFLRKRKSTHEPHKVADSIKL